MCSGKLMEAYFLAGITVILLCFASGTSPPMILPDQTIHGTARHHFEIHDLTDISGGKWKAVHIPDEDITSMLEVANHKKLSSDIQHEAPLYKDAQEAEIGGVKLPVEVHGRVSVFDHIPTMINKSKNSSTSPGKLIVAAENEHRGKEVRPLHVTHPSVIKLRGYTREEEPKNRELIHHKTSAKPSLVVAKIPDDDDGDDSEDLPLRRKLPTPIVAPLRKTRPIIRSGSMRSNILAGIIHQSAKSPTLEPSSNTTSSNPRMSQHPTATQNGVAKSQHTNNDPSVLEKIKSLLLKSSSSPKTSVNTNVPSKKNSGSGKSVSSQKTQPSTENILPANHMPEKVPPASHVPTKVLSTRPNNDGLFLPKTDAFSNHASALNRISSPKREALLLGIIKALLARDRLKIASAKPSATSGVASPLPQYSRQAVLQGLENLQMSKTVEQNDAGPSTPALGSRPGTENPALPGKNVDEVYQKERENEVKQELARANEEALEAKKMSQEESVMLANYDRFSNPESRSNWGNFAGPRQSQTPGGQVLSMLGTQQLNMLEETPNVP